MDPSNTYHKNLYSTYNLKTIIKEIDEVDDSLMRKYKKNIMYTEFLDQLLKDCVNNFYIVVQNLDN